MEQAKRGDWVQIHAMILPAGERALNIPAETQQVPLEMSVKGFLVNEQASIGGQACVRTAAGRELCGELMAVNPDYLIDYGHPQPELLCIGEKLRRLMGGEFDA